MNGLAFVFIGKGSDRGNISLKWDNVIVGVVDLVVEWGEVLDGGVDVRVELVVLVLVGEDFLFEERVLGFELWEVFLEIGDFVLDWLVVDLGVFEVGDQGLVVTAHAWGDFLELDLLV